MNSLSKSQTALGAKLEKSLCLKTHWHQKDSILYVHTLYIIIYIYTVYTIYLFILVS